MASRRASFPEQDCSVTVSTGDELDFEIVSDYQNIRKESGQIREEAYEVAY
ncbi:MAG: hypothetical protein V8R80_07485 [Eubacterium sp.]